MTIIEARDILLQISDLTYRERVAIKTVVAMINRKYMTKLENSYYSLDLNDLPHEIWRDIVGYEGRYQVSNYGRAKSFCSGKARILKPIRRADGYVNIGLHKKGETPHRAIHILVAQAFIPNPDNKPFVNHIDGDKTDNRVENLEWCTPSENVIHVHKMRLIHVSKGTKHYKAQLTPDEVRYIREHHVPYNHEFGATALGKKFNVHPQVVLDVVNRKTYRDVE